MLVQIKNSKTGTVMSVPDPSVMGPGWEVVTDGSGDSAGRRGVDAPAAVNGCRARAVTQMQSDDPRVVRG